MSRGEESGSGTGLRLDILGGTWIRIVARMKVVSG